MVESIYFLKPAWCGDHLAGLWPEQGFQPVTRAIAFRRWFLTFGFVGLRYRAYPDFKVVDSLVGLLKQSLQNSPVAS